MLQRDAALQPDLMSIDDAAETHPIRCGDERRDGLGIGTAVEDPGDEGRRRGERAAFRQRPSRAHVAVGDREQRFDLVLPSEVEAALDETPGGGGGRGDGEADGRTPGRPTVTRLLRG